MTEPQAKITPIKVPLPDDNSDAMLTLCKVLHHNAADLAPSHDIAKLKDFATVADKYDCVLACMFYGRVWLALFWDDTCALPEILAIAYLFDDPHTFKKISATLMLSSDGVKALRKFQKAAPIRFPIDVCDALDRKRAQMELMLTADLMRPITQLVRRGGWDNETREDRDEHRNEVPKCGRSARTFQYIKHLQDRFLWPVLACNWHFGSTIQHLDDFYMDPQELTCCTGCCNQFNDSVKEVSKELAIKSKQGVCLDCLHNRTALEDNDEPPTEIEERSTSSGSSSSGSDSSEDDDEDEEEARNKKIKVAARADDKQCRAKH
ncbi:hypothetical protein FKW77_007596 [Venturia effusa]|uniref:BTB domain-containing protein n=1 Tax=Venturia effusa TaxID=50376 RepID=A0A517LJ50_9PEZI|nr:hypothetical protein FKW77_007596 [Venturia effusa]